MKKGKEKRGGGGGRKLWRQGELNRRRAYQSGNFCSRAQCFTRRLASGTLQLHCEQFWTFIEYANAHAQCDVQHTHKQNYIETGRYPVGISTEFCLKWQKNLQGGKGGKGKNTTGGKTEGEKRKKW